MFYDILFSKLMSTRLLTRASHEFIVNGLTYE